MVWRSRRGAAVGAVLVMAVIAGCAPAVAPAQTPTSTPSVTASPTVAPTPTPTPTPTWNADQAAAIEAVAGYSAAEDKIGADPAAFTEKQMTHLLETVAGGAALDATIKWHLKLKEHGYHFTGEMLVLSTSATKPADDGRGIEVHVTRCQDQRQGRVVDADSNPVGGAEFQIPEYNLRQYSVRKPQGEDAFRVFGYETINGACP